MESTKKGRHIFWGKPQKNMMNHLTPLDITLGSQSVPWARSNSTPIQRGSVWNRHRGCIPKCSARIPGTLLKKVSQAFQKHTTPKVCKRGRKAGGFLRTITPQNPAEKEGPSHHENTWHHAHLSNWVRSALRTAFCWRVPFCRWHC